MGKCRGDHVKVLEGLNHEIADHEEIFPYNTLQDLVHQAMKVEQQQQRGGRGHTIPNRPAAPTWRRPQGATGCGAIARPAMATSIAPVSRPSTTSVSSPASRPSDRCPISSTPVVASSRSPDIECFKCKGRGHIASEYPSRRTLLINEQGEWESESDAEDNGDTNNDAMEELDCDIEADVGDCFISLRVLSVNVVEEEKGQRNNIFHTRGTIKNKVCKIIVDNGSCNNIAGSELVERSRLN